MKERVNSNKNKDIRQRTNRSAIVEVNTKERR